MKKTKLIYLGFIFLMIASCKNDKSINYDDMHIYQPAELQKIVDNAATIEKKGEPVVQSVVNAEDSSTTTTTTQTYLVYYALTKDHHLMPKAEATAVARKLQDGPIVITSVCGMSCKPVGNSRCPDASGCMPNGPCGCTQGSCGSECTTTRMCQPAFSGFGFGGAIMF